MYYVYIVMCADETLYTGITVDLARRVREHNGSPLGARYTRIRRPVRLVYQCQFETRALAASEEYRLKQLARADKLKLIKTQD